MSVKTRWCHSPKVGCVVLIIRFFKVLYFISSSTATFSSWKNHHAMCDLRHNVHHSLLYIHHFPMTLWWYIGRGVTSPLYTAVGWNGVQGEQQGQVLDKKESWTCENILCHVKVSSSDCTENTVWSSNSSFSQSQSSWAELCLRLVSLRCSHQPYTWCNRADVFGIWTIILKIIIQDAHRRVMTSRFR